MFQFASFASHELCVHSEIVRHYPYWVAPFGNPRIKGCLHLPEAYRRLPRPSSTSSTKAFTVRSYFLSRINEYNVPRYYREARLDFSHLLGLSNSKLCQRTKI